MAGASFEKLQHFRETEMYEELSVPLAAYEPAGDEYLYDTAEMKKLFTFWLEKASTARPFNEADWRRQLTRLTLRRLLSSSQDCEPRR